MKVITNNNEKCATALSALKDVIDPEIGLNIVDLGLICQLDFDEQRKMIYVTMTLTTQFCPMGESIVDGARCVLETAFPNEEVNIGLVFDPPWNRDRISEFGIQFLQQ